MDKGAVLHQDTVVAAIGDVGLLSYLIIRRRLNGRDARLREIAPKCAENMLEARRKLVESVGVVGAHLAIIHPEHYCHDGGLVCDYVSLQSNVNGPTRAPAHSIARPRRVHEIEMRVREARDRIGFHKTWVQPRLQRVVKELYGRNIVTIKDDAIAVSQGEWRLRASSDRQN